MNRCYQLHKDELDDYALVPYELTKIKANMYIDKSASFIRWNHSLWVIITNGNPYTDFWIAVSVEEDPEILFMNQGTCDKSSFIYKSGLNNCIKFISMFHNILIEIAKERVNSDLLIDILKHQDWRGISSAQINQICKNLTECIKERSIMSINEIGYRGASLSHGANYNAKRDYLTTKNPNAREKMSKAEEITIPALCKAISDNFPNVSLEFVEQNKNTRRGYGVDLTNIGVKFIDHERCVFQGNLTVANKPFGIGTIEYQFKTGEFYRVSYSDKTTRSRKLHSLILHNENEGNELLSFISKYLYSQEDYENNIDINGFTTSKVRKNNEK